MIWQNPSFQALEGTILLDGENPGDSSVEVSIDAASLDTGVADRDAHLRSGDFFDVENFPAITFQSRSVEGPISSAGDGFQIIGNLTIRGETRRVTLNATFEGSGPDPWGGTRAGFSAETTIDRRDFDLTWNQALETGGVLVGHEIRISLNVQAVLAQESAMAKAEG